MLSHSKSARPGPRSSAGLRLALLIGAVLGAMLLAPLTRAQERPPEIAVLHTAIQQQTDPASLPLSVFFTLRDQNGNIVPRSAVSLDGAEGELTVKPTGAQAFPPVPITVGTPQSPIKIALVIDRSGSMNQLVGDSNVSEKQTLDTIVRNAAVESIKLAPEQAEFAVFSFAERTELQSDGFLRKADQSQLIEDSIRRFTTNPSGTGNTCISDAALEAIKTLNGADTQGAQTVERKAVILFTDGLDKEADKPNGATNCTNADFGSVIRNAQLSSGTIIPIYTIWPCTEPCDQNQRVGLENLARETRGASAIGSLQDVSSLFQRVMELLNSQWLVTANVSAIAGANTATLEVRLEDGGNTLTAATPFESPITTVLAPQLAVAQQRYDSDSDTYKVTLTVVNPQNVGQVVAGVYNLDSGGTLIGQEQRFDNLKERLEFDLSTDGLRSGENYFLRISATGTNKQPLKDQQGAPLLITYPFVYEPKLSYTIGAITPEWQNGPLVVEVNVRGAGQRDLSFSGEIINRNGGAKEALELTTFRDGRLRFPLPTMLREASGPSEYELTLRLEEGENVLEQRTEQPVTLTPPDPPSPPILLFVLAGLSVVIVGVIGSLFYVRSRPQKREIPLPYNSATMLPQQPSALLKPAPDKAKLTPDSAPVSPVAPTQAKIPPAVKITPPVKKQIPMAPPTEIRSSPAPAAATIIHATSEPTVLHTAQRKPRVRIKVLKTLDQAQMREQIIDLPCTIGREQVSFAITGDPKISRLHAEIRVEDGRLLVGDAKSTNGTMVHDQQLESGATAPLEGVTVIGIGPNTLLEVESQ